MPGFGQIGLDNTFNSGDRGFGFGDGPNGTVRDIVTQTDGKVLIIGDFTRYSGASRAGIARLKGNNQGLDSSFVVGTGFTGGTGPKSLTIQPDGKILIVGSFAQYDGSASLNIIRLNSNGTKDNTFSPPLPSGAVSSVEYLIGGKILVGGDFTFTGFNRSMVARLNPNGVLDITFNAGAGGIMSPFPAAFSDLEIQEDGKILVAGQFPEHFNDTTFVPYLPTDPILLIRLNANGSFDNSFSFLRGQTNFSIAGSVKMGAANKIILGGRFSTVYNFTTVNNVNLVQILPNGQPDNSFSNSSIPFATDVMDLEFQSGKVVAAGTFQSVGGLRRGRIARFNSNGALDATFAADSGANGSILAISTDLTGRFHLGGLFTRYDQKGRYGLARISSIGNLDAPYSINTGADRKVYAIGVQPDKKVIIAGEFGYFNWNSSNSVVRIDTNGQFDPTLVTGKGINGIVRAVLIQPDGKIILGGKFDSYNNIRRWGIVRINPNGSIDLSFNPLLGTSETIYSLAIQKNGKILVGGDFSVFNAVNSSGLIRLNSDGSQDPGFNVGAGFDGMVKTIALMRDSLIFVGGDFSNVQGNSRRGIARLKMDGSFDTGFNIGDGISASGIIHTIAIQKDRKVVFGGEFSLYNGNTIKNTARMSADGTFDGSFDPTSLTDGPVYDILIDSLTNTITVVGDFGDNKAVGRNGIVRMKSTGLKDQSQGSGAGAIGAIFAIEEVEGGDKIISGDFESFDDVGRNRAARLKDDDVTVTTWDGSSWDFGIPDASLSASIEGNYAEPGFVCVDLFIQAGRTFEPTGEIEVRADVFSASETNNSTLVFKGSASQEFEGFANNIRLDNSSGLSIVGSSTLKGTLKLTSGNLETNGNLILNSASTGTARVATIESSGSITGNVTARRFVPGATAAWHLMGVPVTGQTQADWSDDFTLLSNFIYQHNEGGSINIEDQVNGWELATGPLEPGKGYRTFLNQSFMNASATFDNSGPLTTGDFPFPINVTPGGYDGGGWNLLANPYACEVDWNGFTKSLIGGQVHFWNQSHYGSYTTGSGISVNGGSRYIPSFQGFFVKATGVGASLSLSETAKPSTPQSNSFLRTAANDPADAARIILRGPNGDKDEAAIRWLPQSQPEFEPEFDADKLINPGMSFFSTTQEGRKSSIQVRNFDNSDIVDLGYKVSQFGAHFLEIHFGQEIFAGKTWELRDNETGYIFPVTADMLFPFEIFEGNESSNFRFSLIGQAPQVAFSHSKIAPFLRVYPNPTNGFLFVDTPNEEIQYSFADLMGRKVKEGAFEKGSIGKINVKDLSPGIYQIRINGLHYSFVQKVQVY